jgi:hypothetical protein
MAKFWGAEDQFWVPGEPHDSGELGSQQPADPKQEGLLCAGRHDLSELVE